MAGVLFLLKFVNMQLRCLPVLIFLFCFNTHLEAQPRLSTTNRKAIALFEKAEKAFRMKQYEIAESDLTEALRAAPDFFEGHLLISFVLEDQEKFKEAASHLQAAIQLYPEKDPKVHYNLARLRMNLGEYEAAITSLNHFLRYRTTPELKLRAENLLASATFAIEAIKKPVPFNPVNLGESINTPESEYFPSFSVDHSLVIFTRLEPRKADTDPRLSKQEDFYISGWDGTAWSKARPLGPPVNTGVNEGAHTISPDGKLLIFTGCGRDSGMGSCDLYISTNSGGKWGWPRNMGPTINTSSWESQPTISADGREIIFASNRSGGKGAADLWITRRNDNGYWGTPENLGDVINTPFDEFGPFLHPDGKSLYFSSAGHPGMGKKDLFISRRNDDGTWSKPVNLGYPINTSADEDRLVVSADGASAFFSSDRKEGFGGQDIYMFELPPDVRALPVTYVKGKVSDKSNGERLRAAIEIIDLSTGRVCARTISDSKTGEFLVSLPTGSRYALNASAKGYLLYSETYSFNDKSDAYKPALVDIPLAPIRSGESVVLRNIFFESGSDVLQPESKIELDRLASLLSENAGIQMEIGGHTDNVGNDASNLNLSERRAASVLNYLVEKGIDKSRLKAKGYGEYRPIATNDTEEGRSRNRRTEFLIL